MALGMLTLFLSGVMFFESRYLDSFYPGVSIGGESVGGRTYEEVFADFEKRAHELTRDGFAIVFSGERGEKKVQVPLATAGLTADILVEYFSLGNWEETIGRAYKMGRSGSSLKQFKDKLGAIILGNNFKLPVALQAPALKSLLSREIKSFFKETTSAQFVYESGGVFIAKEKRGETVSAGEIATAISQKLASFDPTPLSVLAAPNAPAVTGVDLEPFLKLANDIATQTSLVFYYNRGRWKVSGPTLVTWLTLKKENEIGIDGKKLKNFLTEKVAPLINDPPRNSRFEIRRGRLFEIEAGKSGNVVDIEKTIQRVEKIVYGVQGSYAATGNILFALTSAGSLVNIKTQTGSIEVPIETIQAEPAVTKQTVDSYGIVDLIGFAKTSFKGSSADRRHNIEVGVSKLNGILLAPGEEFSAVKAIGETTAEEGFVEEYVIKDNKSVKEFGGGLCQVATTLFRLALDAGLSITERVNHRYVVSYYGPGLDATIYGPKPDLRFVNNTDNYILLQGKVAGSEVVFEFYGEDDGRLVKISTPVLTDEIPAPEIKYIYTADLPFGKTNCSETPRKGVTADVLYSVYYLNGETKEQSFHSEYEPWQRICLVGTGQ